MLRMSLRVGRRVIIRRMKWSMDFVSETGADEMKGVTRTSVVGEVRQKF